MKHEGLLPDDGRFIHRVGPTPLVPVGMQQSPGTIFCKLEFLNPSGSTKDRIARYILEKAWRSGALACGHVIEASSGSTSIALALACAQMGLSFTAVIPDAATSERVWTIRAYGGETVKVPGGMAEAVALAREMSVSHGWFFTNQFENYDNVMAQCTWTGQEILAQIPGGRVDAVVAGVGTGGTLQGLHKAFTEAGGAVLPAVAVPMQAELLAGNIECCSLAFSHRIPGVVDCISALHNRWKETVPDLKEVPVPDEDALETTRELQRRGFPVGPSSGLNYAAAVAVARELEPGSQVVTVFPDRMERYFSHRLFEEIRAGK